MDNIFTNKDAFFTTINEYILFRGLVSFDNKIREEWYRALDVVMRHYNKA